MDIRAERVSTAAIQALRDRYRIEMSRQIVHDALHERQGWTQEYRLAVGGTTAGYGSVAVAGPWTGVPAIYEFYVAADWRLHVFDLFEALLTASSAVSIEVQTNDPLAAVMLHAFATQVSSESILFEDGVTTGARPAGAVFRAPSLQEAPDADGEQRRWLGVVEIDGHVAATGGILFHYNRPYGDIYMEVSEPFRRRGLGTFVVQELKRVCYEGGHVPAARCHPANVASRRTLQKAGFVPCGHILKGVTPSRMPGPIR